MTLEEYIKHINGEMGENHSLSERTVRTYMENVMLEEGNEPRKSNHADQGPVGTDPCLGQFEMTIPSQCHEDIAHNQ